MDIESLKKIDYLLTKKSGCTMTQLKTNLGLTPRQIKYHIQTLRKVFGCPIGYDTNSKTYFYTVKGRCLLKFEESKVDLIVETISANIRRLLGVLSI